MTSASAVPPLLSCQGVDVSYGSVQVLFGVDLEVHDGEILALLGTNGAGKSTLLKAAAGLIEPTRGRVCFGGEDITGEEADRVTGRGLSLMPGGRSVFPTLTVAENMRLAGWLLRKDRAAVEAARDKSLALFPVLRDRWNTMAGNLSGGEQQMLALAQAFSYRPRLLMIDELSLGLAPTIVDQLLEVVRQIHAAGTTVVLVEQSVNLALTAAHRAVFMEKGEVRFTGPARELLQRPDLLRSVFLAGASKTDTAGGDGTALRPRPRSARQSERASEAADAERPVVLSCRGVTKRFGGIRAIGDVDLDLRDGQILGLIGHNGAGKTTLLDLISGFQPTDAGRVELLGRDVSDWQPYQRALSGLGRSFQDARLFPSLTTRETIAVALERHLDSRSMLAAVCDAPASFHSEAAAAARVDELIELTGLQAFSEKLVGELSTGSRRIVDLACILAQEPAVVLLDEPSAGVAQRETEALGPLLLRVRERAGCSMIVVEHDMPLLRSISDELLALELGSVIASGPPSEVLEHPKVIASYLGTNDETILRSGEAATAANGGSRARRRRAARH